MEGLNLSKRLLFHALGLMGTRLAPEDRITLLAIVGSMVRQDLKRQLMDLTGGIIQGGPFAGCRLLRGTSWSRDGDFVPKVLGCYEAELHNVLTAAASRRYDTFIDVGCAEGYYATGFSRLSEQTRVLAFDTSPSAQEIARASARDNGVADRVEVFGALDPEGLASILARSGRTFILSDCEGFERTLLDPSKVPSLSRTDMLIECHDFIEPGATECLMARFSRTHAVTRIDQGARNPHRAEPMWARPELVRWLMVCESRAVPMHWLHCLSSRGQIEARDGLETS
jgi:predicted O-methyltransferase YrrM